MRSLTLCLVLLSSLGILAGCSSDTNSTSGGAHANDAGGDGNALADASSQPDTAADVRAHADASESADAGADDGGAPSQDTSPADASQADTSTGNGHDIWISAYFASWNHYAPPGGNWGNLPTDAIDWDAFTQMIYFAMHVNADGSLGPVAQYQNMNPDRINAIVAAAHAHHKPILISVGGAGNHDEFAAAIASGVRSDFVANLVQLLDDWGFDGIDIDMEPIRSADEADFKAFIHELHTALQSKTTPMLSRPRLTAAVGREAALFHELQDAFDQINLMTYDFSGAWQGWVTWHNSCLSNGGYTFPSTGQEVPSVEREVRRFMDAGVPAAKLGIGIDFYGYVWSGGVYEPRQSWTTAPTVDDNVAYHDLIADYDFSTYYRWDPDAHAAYLSIQDQTPQKFVSFDDERSITEKINYVRQQGLGGAIVWELGGGYVKDAPAGHRDPLLQAVKSALNGN